MRRGSNRRPSPAASAVCDLAIPPATQGGSDPAPPESLLSRCHLCHLLIKKLLRVEITIESVWEVGWHGRHEAAGR